MKGMAMPTSAKPRKPHRGVHLPSAYQAAKHFTDILIRGFRGWGGQDKMRVGFFFLEPFGALRASKGTDAEAHQYFSNAKARLVLAYGISYVLPRKTSGEPERSRIADANWSLQVAFDCYVGKKRMLYPQLKRMQRIAQEQFEGIVEHFEPYQIDAARGNLRPGGKRARMYDKVEADLDQAALGGKHGLRRVSA